MDVVVQGTGGREARLMGDNNCGFRQFSFAVVERLLKAYCVSTGRGKRKGMGESASSWLLARKTKNESCKKVLSRKRE